MRTISSQDQYREDDVDEFRELRRDLEQTAKNCRVLQFKLRKTERQKEQVCVNRKACISTNMLLLQAEAERTQLEQRLTELSSAAVDAAGGAVNYLDRL